MMTSHPFRSIVAKSVVVFAIMSLILVICGTVTGFAQENTPVTQAWQIGFGKRDVTPGEPIRLSGYGSREKVFEAVADRLSCRAMALSRSQLESETMILVSIDSIAVTAEFTSKIASNLEERYGIPRSQLVVCSTHSHTAPHVAGGLLNLFQTALAHDEIEAIQRNTDRMIEQTIAAIDHAIRDRKPGLLSLGGDQAGFAVNRRVLKDGVWSGFGIQADGAVDRRVRVLRATDMDGQLRGAIFMYACHCTTLGGDFNQVSGDWAGLAATELEKAHPGATVLATIGCGADANPNPRTSYENAKSHAAEIVAAVNRAFAGDMRPLTVFPVGHFGYAGLAPEQPTREHLKDLASDSRAVNQRWSEAMTKIWNEKGRLPETYPAPIHTWQFGEELTWVFLGGEVVVDYQMKLEQLLPGKNIWVAAYTDDVFAYVASERMRVEGGYEVDFSMIYYLQPGRWATGTEALLLRRVREVLEDVQADDKPRDAQSSLKAIDVPGDFVVDLMACEPNVVDPVNIAFGHDGRVWVVEMADYPQGNTSGGRVRWLLDADGDGSLDQSQVFLEGLSYPTSVAPWRDGVLIIAAPEVIFAKDADGDGQADSKETLLLGLNEANPQHRASGFEMGLDGWLHFGAGDGTEQIESKRAGRTYRVAHSDVAWNPDTGEIRTTTGETQFCRARDEFDRWFGNSNSKPMYQYVIDDKYIRGRSLGGPSQQSLLDPPLAPPVYPASRTVDRFNDLFALNRFTSACSSIICRVPGLGESMRGAALICEPVHNLVARYRVSSDGATMMGTRFDEDAKQDWFASSDPWSRPVRAVNAPDGTIWIVDMQRQVIEHPEWIPEAWQKRYDIRSGQNLGRIYRVRQRDYQPASISKVSALSVSNLVEWLGSDNSAMRDLAQYQLQWRPLEERNAAKPGIQRWMRSSVNPGVRLQSLATLISCNLATSDDVAAGIADQDPRVMKFAVSAAEAFIDEHPNLLTAILKRSDDLLGAEVDLQVLLTLGTVDHDFNFDPISRIIRRQLLDPWCMRVLPLVHENQVDDALKSLMSAIASVPELSTKHWSEIEVSLSKLLKRSSINVRRQLIEQYLGKSSTASHAILTPMQLILLCGLANAMTSGDQAMKDASLNSIGLAPILELTRGALEKSVGDPKERSRWISLLGRGLSDLDSELKTLKILLAPNQPPEIHENAMMAIRRINDPRAADLLIKAWASLTPETRRAACTTLLQRRPSIEKLLTAMESNAISVRDLDAATIQQLRSRGDRSLIARCEQILGRPTNRDRARLVNDYLAKSNVAADRTRGEQLYKQHCASCHLATPSKPIVGPPLENLKHWSIEQWVSAVLDPNRTLEPKYHQYAVVTSNGQLLSGLIENRTETSIILAISDGTRREIELSDIESIKDAGISLMPEGLETALSPDQLFDLLAFLRS